MTKLYKVLFFALLIFSSFKTSAQGCMKLDVVIAVDMSGSIYSNRIPFIVNSVLAFANRFELSEEGIKISIIKFNDGAFLLSPLTSDKDILLRGIGALSKTDGDTHMHAALEMAGNEFMTNGRQGYSKIVVLLTDGEPTMREQTTKAAELLKTALNVKIFGIFINNRNEIDEALQAQFANYGYSGSGEVYLKSISSEGCYLQSNYEMLIEEIRKLDVCL